MTPPTLILAIRDTCIREARGHQDATTTPAENQETAGDRRHETRRPPGEKMTTKRPRDHQETTNTRPRHKERDHQRKPPGDKNENRKRPQDHQARRPPRDTHGARRPRDPPSDREETTKRPGDHPQRTDHQDTTRRPPRDRYDTKKPPRDNETTKRPRRDHWAMNRTPRGDHQEATRSHLDTFQRTPRHHEQTTHVEKNEEADRATSQRPLRDHLSSNWCMKKHGANALFGEHQALRETVFARTMTCFGNARQMFSTKKQRPAKSMHRTIVADTRRTLSL